ncbi:hypothetical protein [Streptomyces sp. NPDC048623]|uniref:hypothetical protein n=1 Tax=Streptomyces sp. NPDC048623 TaxID=3155761 RepID=UPI003443140F
MIRAGRKDKVRTLADLAAQRGMTLGSYQNLRPYAAAGFPEPISSKGSRTRLFDGDQVDAHLAGAPIPPLPEHDDDTDLLDRREAADLLGITPGTWDTYKTDPRLTEHLTDVGGVEHWPRHIVRAYPQLRADTPRQQTTAGGRPKRSGDQVPRDQLLDLTAPLLDDDPAITATHVVDALGVHRDTAQRALTLLRGRRIADRLEHDPTLTPEQAAAELGYPTSQTQNALTQAATELRARAATHYLATVTQTLHEAGLTDTAEPPAVQQTDNTLRAALPLSGRAPAPVAVWSEDSGWSTATRRRHPFTDPHARPLLTGAAQPAPHALLAALTA